MNMKVVNEMASLKETNHITSYVIYCKNSYMFLTGTLYLQFWICFKLHFFIMKDTKNARNFNYNTPQTVHCNICLQNKLLCANYFSVLSYLIYWASCHTEDNVQSLSSFSQIRVHVSLVAWCFQIRYTYIHCRSYSL